MDKLEKILGKPRTIIAIIIINAILSCVTASIISMPGYYIPFLAAFIAVPLGKFIMESTRKEKIEKIYFCKDILTIMWEWICKNTYEFIFNAILLIFSVALYFTRTEIQHEYIVNAITSTGVLVFITAMVPDILKTFTYGDFFINRFLRKIILINFIYCLSLWISGQYEKLLLSLISLSKEATVGLAVPVIITVALVMVVPTFMASKKRKERSD